MITFTDGTKISWEEAAELIEAEGKLIANTWCNDENERCAVGVIENWHQDGSFAQSARVMVFDWLCRVQKANDKFKGTTEARAVYMAQWCRNQEGV